MSLNIKAQVNTAYHAGWISALLYSQIRAETTKNPTAENKHYYSALKDLIRQRKIQYHGVGPMPAELR